MTCATDATCGTFNRNFNTIGAISFRQFNKSTAGFSFKNHIEKLDEDESQMRAFQEHINLLATIYHIKKSKALYLCTDYFCA